MSTASATPSWSRAVGLGVGLAAVVSIVLLAFAWPTVTSEPRELPLAVAGPTEAVESLGDALEENAPGAFALVEAEDRDAAVVLVEERRAYGAVVLGASPEVLTTSAASPIVAQQLAAIAARLEAELSAAAAAQAPEGVTPPVVHVEVTDLVPLAEADPRGAGLVAAVFPLVLGGVIGGVAVSLALGGRGRRLVALAVYAVVGGASLAGILQGWFGVLQGSFLMNSAVLGLGLLAIAAPVAGLAAVLGRPGIALGALTMVLVANPISSAALPLEFLPAPWGAVGQWFPPGAAATLIRDVSYFPDAATLFPWLVLAAWAVAGVLLASISSPTRRLPSRHADENADSVRLA